MIRIFLDISTTGLNAYKHRIGCISVNLERQTFSFCDKDEQKMLKQFVDFLTNQIAKNEKISIYSFRTNEFVVPFLKTRLMKHNLLNNYLDLYGKVAIFDLQQMFFSSQFFGVIRKPKLGEIIKLFGIKAPMLIKGEDKKYMFENDMLSDLVKYTEQSVTTIKKVFLTIKTKLDITEFEKYEFPSTRLME